MDAFATYPPSTVAPSVRPPPMIEASTTWPGRILYMYRPTSNAIGIVQAIVKVPQELPGTRRTELGGSFQNALPESGVCRTDLLSPPILNSADGCRSSSIGVR